MRLSEYDYPSKYTRLMFHFVLTLSAAVVVVVVVVVVVEPVDFIKMMHVFDCY